MNNGAGLLKKREDKFRGMSCDESNYTCINALCLCFPVMSTVLVIMHRFVVKHSMRITNISDNNNNNNKEVECLLVAVAKSFR